MNSHQNPSEIQNNSNMPFQKYRAFKTIDLPDRLWPSAVITSSIVVLSRPKGWQSSSNRAYGPRP